MKILVIAEHDNQQLKAATLNTLTAARQLAEQAGDASIEVLVAGAGCGAVAEQAGIAEGVDRVLLADSAACEHQLAENLSLLISELQQSADLPWTHILAPATTAGKNLLPRVAALLDVAAISDIVAVVSADTFVRPIYAGNALATVQSGDPLKVITVRNTAFEAVDTTAAPAPVTTLTDTADAGISRFIGEELQPADRVELTSARVIISGGRGMQSGDNFPLLEKVADKLGAAVGASRAAVDSGFVPNDMQVGQTGKIVAPDLYIAVGISGAIQHLAGMKDSKVIVAINQDEEAPIFQVADYGLVDDLFRALPELEQQL